MSPLPPELMVDTRPDTPRPPPKIPPQQVTGLVLAGGRGTRMGGVDKGLQTHEGMPLALLTLMRLQLQVGQTMVNANRNLAAYESFGVPVWPDTLADHPGPLAGMLAGLERCETPYLVTVPCDTPSFPEDLVERLGNALVAEAADVAMAASLEPIPGQPNPVRRTQPVFLMLKAALAEKLLVYLQGGGRKIDEWTAQQRCVVVDFYDPTAFFNVNTPEDLRALAGDTAPPPRPGG